MGRAWLGFLIAAGGLSGAPVVTPVGAVRAVAAPGETISFAVSVAGSGAVSHQWRHRGQPVGDGSSRLTFPADYASAGWYVVDVTDSTGTTRSQPFFAQVVPTQTQLRLWGAVQSIPVSPAAETDLAELSPGPSTLLGLRRDGTAEVWFHNGHSGRKIFPNLTDAVQVAAGISGLALRQDGAVVSWNYSNPTYTNLPQLSGVVAIASGFYHGLALRADGTVAAWEHAPYTGNAYLTAVPNDLAEVIQIDAGDYHSLALKRDGTVVAWGGNSGGQLDVPAGLTGVVAIAANGSVSMALKGDGTVVMWGFNGVGATSVPAGLSDVVEIATSGGHSLARRADGILVGWGYNNAGQATVPPGLDQVIGISAAGGYGFSFVLRDASADAAPVVAIQPSPATAAETLSATFSVTATGAFPLSYQWRRGGVDIPGATASTLVLKELLPSDSTTIDVIVKNHRGTAASNAVALVVNPVPVITSLTAPRQMRVPGAHVDLVVTATGTGPLHYQWIKDSRPVPGAVAATLSMANLTSADSGTYWVLITDDHGTRRSAPIFVRVVPLASRVIGWGTGGSFIPPTIPASLEDAIAVSTSGETTWFLRRDGTVVGTGWNVQAVQTLTDVVDIAVTESVRCALKSDGTVVSWGIAPPAGLKDVVSIAAGRSFIAALRTDGSVVAWGSEFSAANLPAEITGVVDMAAGLYQLFVLKADGSVNGWAVYHAGGTVVPLGLKDVTRLESGRTMHYAFRADGSIYGWGNGYRPETALPGPISDIAELKAGEDHTLARLPNGLVVAWGRNTDGQATVPADVDHAFAIAAGGRLSYAVCDTTQVGAPVWGAAPATVVAVAGDAAQMDMPVSGALPLSFVWQAKPSGSASWSNLVDGETYAGTSTPTLRLTNVSQDQLGTVYRCLAANNSGNATGAEITLVVKPALAIATTSGTRHVLHPGENLTLAVTATGSGPVAYQWRRNGRVVPDATASTLELSGVQARDAGYYVAMASDENGVAYSAPFFVAVMPAQTSVRTWKDDRTFVHANIRDGIAVAAGPLYPLVLRRNGTVVDVGGNPYPVWRVPEGLSEVVAIAVGGDFGYALKGDGTLTTWGHGGFGETGLPANLANVVALSPAGGGYVIKHDGTVTAWGYNTGARYLLGALSNIVAITGGMAGGPALLLTDDGKVHGFPSGQVVTEIPAGLVDVVSIAQGSSHALALKSDGTVVAWGSNDQGQLNIPAGLSGVVAISAAGGYSLAVKSDGTAVGWGTAYFGQTTMTAEDGRIVALAAGYWNAITLSDTTKNDISYQAYQIVGTVIAGGLGVVEVTVENGGSRGWTTSHLVVLRDQAGKTVAIGGLAGLQPGASRIVQLRFVAPVQPGLHRYRLQALEDGVEWFGAELALNLDVGRARSGADFNGDGRPDLLWQNTATGQRALWLLQGDFTAQSVVSLGWVSPEWSMAAATDFNTDGNVDILWQNTVTGQRALWLMNGGDFTPMQIVSLGWVDATWSMAAATDFNTDGNVDILWQNTVTGQRALWLMNGGDFTPTQIVSLGWVSPEWSMAAAADFNADGKVDILWQNTVTGQRALWLMNGGDFTPMQIVSLGWVDPTWSMASAADVNADGKVDILWQNMTTGQRALWLMNGGDFTPIQIVNLGFVPTEWMAR